MISVTYCDFEEGEGVVIITVFHGEYLQSMGAISSLEQSWLYGHITLATLHNQWLHVVRMARNKGINTRQEFK